MNVMNALLIFPLGVHSCHSRDDVHNLNSCYSLSKCRLYISNIRHILWKFLTVPAVCLCIHLTSHLYIWVHLLLLHAVEPTTNAVVASFSDTTEAKHDTLSCDNFDAKPATLYHLSRASLLSMFMVCRTYEKIEKIASHFLRNMST